VWRYRFDKVPAPGVDGGGQDDLEVSLLLEGDRIGGMVFPGQFADFLNGPNLQEVFSPVRGAEVHREEKSTEWGWSEMAIEIATLDDVLRRLGPPTEQSGSEEAIRLLYDYGVAGDTNPRVPPPHMRLVYRFDPGPRTLMHCDARLGKLRVVIDLTGEKDKVTVARR
jgi:hypothetical protein